MSAHVSLFFDGPGMVVALEAAEEVVEDLHASLGERYRRQRVDGQLFSIVRTDKPTQLLAEIAHVERALGARAARRFGASPRAPQARRWHVVEALRASSWQLGSLSFSRKVGDQHRQLRASISVIVDSTSTPPTCRRGIAAHLSAWVPRTSKRWRRFYDETVTRLTAQGFRVPAREPLSFHCSRSLAGLSRTPALKQADALERLLDAGADVVGS